MGAKTSLAHISCVSQLWGCLRGPHIQLSRWRSFSTIFLINPPFPGGCTSSHSLEFLNAFTDYQNLFPSVEMRAVKVKCTYPLCKYTSRVTILFSHSEIYLNTSIYLYVYIHTHTHTYIYPQEDASPGFGQLSPVPSQQSLPSGPSVAPH